MDGVVEEGIGWNMLREIMRLKDELAASEARAKAWEEEARRYATNADYHQETREAAEAGAKELEVTGRCKMLAACHKQMEWDENRIRELEEQLRLANIDCFNTEADNAHLREGLERIEMLGESDVYDAPDIACSLLGKYTGDSSD